MKKSFWRLCVASSFSSGHALRNYKGKCEQLHGHNFSVEVVVEGDSLTTDTELLMDYSDLKKILKEVLERLDHKVLNDTPPFDVMNPSSENIARYIYQQFASFLASYPVRMYSVTVGEKEGQKATYYEVD